MCRGASRKWSRASSSEFRVPRPEARVEMATIQRFEDLIAWQKARALARDVYLLTRDEAFRKDFGLASQIQRAAVSVMANLAEGYERRRRVEFHRYVEIAKASCAE